MGNETNRLFTPRDLLAYFWSICCAYFIGYILYRWGGEKEILTLIIGLIGGTILGGIMGVYFAGGIAKPHNSSDSTVTAEMTGTITQTPKTDEEAK